MSVWETEADFHADLINITSFKPVVPPERAKRNETVQKSLWYEMMNDDETTELTDTPDHLQICDEVQREVQNTLGRCYSNEHIEKYYRNMPQSKIDEPPVPKKVTTSGRHKSNVANDIIDAVQQLNIKKNGETALTGANSKSERIVPKYKKTKHKKNRAQSEVMCSTVEEPVDILSEYEFPQLKYYLDRFS